MIEYIRFKNYKVLRDTTLPLGRFTLIVGPNGSGKSTALQGIDAAYRASWDYDRLIFKGAADSGREAILIEVAWREDKLLIVVRCECTANGKVRWHVSMNDGRSLPQDHAERIRRWLAGLRILALDAEVIARGVPIQPDPQLSNDGGNLAAVLDHLRDHEPARFQQINDELGKWIPEFDEIAFDTPSEGRRSVKLRTREEHHEIPAQDLSQGTLLALAILTATHRSDLPPIMCFEEPDRGLHPRLLRDIRDALYRLAYPESCGEDREAVQVIATTHSPYMLDLFRDHPEEIVIANKVGNEARFERLSDRDDIDDILKDAHLGDVWYSGILGGVPAEQ